MQRRWRWLLVLGLVLAAALVGLVVSPWPGRADHRPPLYRVTLPAAGREARTALVNKGVMVDAVGEGTVTTVVDAAGLARLVALGLKPLDVTPLDFPPYDSAYHNYQEMVDAIRAVAAAHPDIVHITSAGASLEGRDILAVRISDQPTEPDATEPAVLFMGLTHAREHLTVEMTLAIIRFFAEGYGIDPALTNLVEQREIYVLPSVNPDGGEYDIRSGFYDYWRKNRRPNPGGSFGVDLNRNYGYKWGCCGGSSSTPSSDTYRGGEAFSEPETQAVRDFFTAHPNITSAISFHTYGELVLYPYGYTFDPLPADMNPDDHRAFVALAQAMAATNGYTPQQQSDLYITSGDTCDWLYGALRVFCFTFEMYPASSTPGFYPQAAVIETETRRNLAAVTALAAAAENPRKIIGLGGDREPPTVSLPPPAGTLVVGQPITLTAAASDDRGVTLVAWQADRRTLAIDRTAPYTVEWTPAAPGQVVLQALAFDAGGNPASTEPFTVTVLARAEATLHLPQPPVLHRSAPLSLTFSQPITGSSIALAFDPPVSYLVLSSDSTKALIVHEPFQPATRYHLSLEGGRGPAYALVPQRWEFDTEWAGYLPALGGP